MQTERLIVSRDGGVMRITLNRPAKRNAIDMQTCIELHEAFERFDTDADLRVVLLDAAGPVFCAGADLSERQGKGADWVMARRKAAFRAYAAIEACRKPVVALAHGAVVGSGGEIVLACDFAIAADTATFRFPEPQWGTVGATQRLQRAIGRRSAKELLFTGRAMAADEALTRGLVARVVAADALAPTGDEVAAGIAAAPALAIELTKQAMNLGAGTDLENAIRIEQLAIARNLEAGDWRDGVARFAARASHDPDAGPDQQ